jgi:hypothetical protein
MAERKNVEWKNVEGKMSKKKCRMRKISKGKISKGKMSKGKNVERKKCRKINTVLYKKNIEEGIIEKCDVINDGRCGVSVFNFISLIILLVSICNQLQR